MSLYVVAEKPQFLSSDKIDASRLLGSVSSEAQQSGAGTPIYTGATTQGQANATAELRFSTQTQVGYGRNESVWGHRHSSPEKTDPRGAFTAVQVDAAAQYVGTVSQVGSLVTTAGIPCGSIVRMLGQSSSPLAFICLPVPVAQQIQVRHRVGTHPPSSVGSLITLCACLRAEARVMGIAWSTQLEGFPIIIM